MKVQVFRLSDLPILEESWRQLEHGEDMTVFQGFDWYRAVARRQRHEHASRLTISHRIYTVHDEVGNPLLIAPMRFHHASLSEGHHRGVYFAGRGGSADYLNFVYSDFSPEALGLVLSRVEDDFPRMPFHLERVLAGTASHGWLSQWAASRRDDVAVSVEVPADSESYQAMLSKSTRQNLRTARNRLTKDGFELEVVIGGHPSKEDAEGFAALRSARRRQRNARSGPPSLTKFAHRARQLASAALFADFNETDSLMTSHPSAWHLQVRIGGRLAAYAFGFGEHWHSVPTLRITQVAYAEEMGRYSPGLVGLHHYIAQVAARADPPQRTIDFTRGEESYKFALGGLAHVHSSFVKGA